MKVDLELPYIPSENYLYKPASSIYYTKNKRPRTRSWLYMPDELKEFKANLIDMIKNKYASDIEEMVSHIEDWDYYHIISSYVFYLPHSRFYGKDVSNMIKLIEDSLMSATGLDDSHVVAYPVFKFLHPEDKFRMIINMMVY